MTDFDEQSAELISAGEISATPLDPIAGAAAAIDAADAAALPTDAPIAASAPIGAAAPVAADTATAPSTAAAPLNLTKPFIQIGIFSIEANANTAAGQMADLGLAARVVPQVAQGRDFWSVIVGPASSEADRASQLDKIKAAGFGDAYFVRN